MSGTLPINSNHWQGWRCLMSHPTEAYGNHVKSISRRPIANTSAGAIAHRMLHDKDPGDYLSVGERVLEVYHSCMQFEPPEARWTFSRVLGCGSFGLACLWETDNPYNKQKIVAKSELPTDKCAVHTHMKEIPREVFHLAQINDRIDKKGDQRVGATQLLGFKYITGDYSTQGDGNFQFQADPTSDTTERPFYREWRTFIENCNYGTLTRVMLTYKAWGYHVPEAFVWWTFLWLMEACKAMDQNPGFDFHQVYGRSVTQELTGSYILHNDIKDDNIFVGPARPEHEYALGAPFDRYPAARMGDFGLSRLAIMNHENRPGRFPKGTRIWMAPEKRIVSMGYQGDMIDTYPFFNSQRLDPVVREALGGVPTGTDHHCIGPEANVWGAAAAIYLLMTLEDIGDFNDIVKDKLSAENTTRDTGNEGLYLFDLEYFPTFLDGDEDYSDELKNLVRECTRVEPMKRPHIDTILAEIHKGIRQEHNRLRDEFGDSDEAIYDATRMAFTNEEWLEVPEGPWEMIPRSVRGMPGGGSDNARRRWRNFHHVVEEWADPDAPTLVPPYQYRTRVPGDTAPANYTTANPRLDHSFHFPALPFYGDDWILYVDEAFIAPYHKGPSLPRGGRAWAWQMEEGDGCQSEDAEWDMEE